MPKFKKMDNPLKAKYTKSSGFKQAGWPGYTNLPQAEAAPLRDEETELPVRTVQPGGLGPKNLAERKKLKAKRIEQGKTQEEVQSQLREFTKKKHKETQKKIITRKSKKA